MTRLHWLVALAFVTAFTSATSAGELDPPAPPAPTMKTLDQIPGSWDRTLPASDGTDACNSSRFKCVLSSAGVLDKETGLVWDRAPDSSSPTAWGAAQMACLGRLGGARGGWRLPRAEEAGSLLSIAGGAIRIPTGHPFTLDSASFWTSTASRATAGAVIAMTINASAIGTFGSLVERSADTEHSVWCVRGGAGSIE